MQNEPVDKVSTFSPKRSKMVYIKRVKQTDTILRKIETQMIAAINSRKDWKSGNTEVFINGNNCANVAAAAAAA